MTKERLFGMKLLTMHNAIIFMLLEYLNKIRVKAYKRCIIMLLYELYRRSGYERRKHI